MKWSVVFFFLFFSFLPRQHILAQEMPFISVEKGEYLDVGYKDLISGFVGVTKKAFFVLRVTPETTKYNSNPIFLDVFDRDLNPIKSLQIKECSINRKEKIGKGKKVFEFIAQDGDQNIWLFYSELSEQFTQLYKRKLLIETLSFDDPILVTEHIIDEEVERRRTYNIVISENKKHYAVYSFPSGRKKPTTVMAYVGLMNSELEIIKEINTEVKDFDLGYENFLNMKVTNFPLHITDSAIPRAYFRGQTSISNNGQFYKFQLHEREKGRNSSDTLTIYHCNSIGDNHLNTIKIDVSKNPIIRAKMRINNLQNGFVNIVGLYTKPESGELIAGISQLTFPYDKEPSEKDLTLMPFSEKMKKDYFVSHNGYTARNNIGKNFHDEKTLRRLKKGKEIELGFDGHLIDLQIMPDGSLTLISEHRDDLDMQNGVYFDRKNLLSETKMFQESITTFYGDVRFVNISPENNINWVINHDKHQTLTNTSIASIGLFKSSNNLQFVFNDFFEDGISCCSLKNDDGSITCRVIADWGRKNVLGKNQIQPNCLIQLDNNQLVSIAYAGRRYQLAKFTFSEK